MPPPERAALDTDTLNVFYAERLIGRLRYDAKEQLYSFDYDEAWRNDAAAFDLAPLLPKKERTHAGTAVRFFFSNLLPEGEMLEIVSRTYGVSQYDPFGLLRKIGAECAGALKILESATAAPDGKTYRPVSVQALSASARVDATDYLANVGGKLRMSLAGVQDKLPALFAANGDVFIPEVGSASTHILKPNNRHWQTFPHTAANEQFCMELARRMGLDVPRSTLVAVPERIYVVERFDRVFTAPLVVQPQGDVAELQGEPVHRLHQIDVCQLLGLPPTQKYEEPEFQTPPGPNISTVANALAEATGEALWVRRWIVEWVIFNYLIGNSDSHSKNISLLWKDGRWRLAPVYDLVSVAVYSDDPEKFHDFAFNIGGETRYGWITGAHWHDFAKDIGVNYRYVQAALKRISGRINTHAKDIVEEMARQIDENERALLGRIVPLIGTHSSYATEAAATIAAAARVARGARDR